MENRLERLPQEKKEMRNSIIPEGNCLMIGKTNAIRKTRFLIFEKKEDDETFAFTAKKIIINSSFFSCVPINLVNYLSRGSELWRYFYHIAVYQF